MRFRLITPIKAIVCRWRFSTFKVSRRHPYQPCHGRQSGVIRRLAAPPTQRVRISLGAASREFAVLMRAGNIGAVSMFRTPAFDPIAVGLMGFGILLVAGLAFVL